MKVWYKMLEIKTLTRDHELWQTVAEYASGCSWQPVGTDFSNNMKNNNFTDWERVFSAIENGNIAGFCAITKTSSSFGDTYSPYIGMVFVGEDNRGNRISEKLCLTAIEYAKSIGFDKVYLYSDHVNLYEKYGFVKIDEKQAHWGTMQSIYERKT